MSTLGYWKIRGYVQYIRYLLEYVGEDYTDIMYQQGDAPDFSSECWTSVKHSLGLELPNLPYYKDDKVNISQSVTILRYLGRKYRLDGSTDEEKLRVDLVVDEMLDLRTSFGRVCYNPDYENLRAGHKTTIQPRIEAVEKFLADRKWFAGDKLTFADFLAYEVLEHQRMLELGMFDNTPNLNAYRERFQGLPKIKEYLASGRMPSAVCNRVAAVFNQN